MHFTNMRIFCFYTRKLLSPSAMHSVHWRIFWAVSSCHSLSLSLCLTMADGEFGEFIEFTANLLSDHLYLLIHSQLWSHVYAGLHSLTKWHTIHTVSEMLKKHTQCIHAFYSLYGTISQWSLQILKRSLRPQKSAMYFFVFKGKIVANWTLKDVAIDQIC